MIVGKKGQRPWVVFHELCCCYFLFIDLEMMVDGKHYKKPKYNLPNSLQFFFVCIMSVVNSF